MTDHNSEQNHPDPATSFRYDACLPETSRLLETLLQDSEINLFFESYYKLLKIPIAIIDLKGNVLFSSRWQRICTQFHRAHPDTCARCVTSDRDIAPKISEKNKFVLQPCPNGLIDCAAPIVLDDTHVANLFIGQFLTAPPDVDKFRRQAEDFGFDVTDYLAALQEIPIVEEARIPDILNLLHSMSRVITQLVIDRKRILDGKTERMAEEAALRERELLQRTILEELPVGTIVIDPKTQYIELVNHTALGLLGLTDPEEMIGRHCQTFICLAQEDSCPIKDLGLNADHSERVMLHANGSRIPILKTVRRVELNGQDKLLECFSDLSPLKLVEEELRHSIKKNRTILEAIPDIIIQTNREGECLDILSGSDEHLLLPKEAMLGKKLSEVLPELPAQQLLAGIREALGTKRLQLVNYQLTVPAGESYFEARIVPLCEETALALTRDVTEQKRAEEALQKSELKFRTMLETIPAAIFLTSNNHSTIDFLSKHFTRLLGYSLEDLPTLGRWMELAHPDEADRRRVREETMENFRKSLDDPSYSTSMLSEVTCKDGSQKQILWQALMLGEQWMGCGFDLTHVIKVEAELQNERNNLEAIFKSSPIAMMALDENTSIILANAVAVKLCGGDESMVLHHRPGDALLCSASQKAGCGCGPDCHLCPVRRSLEDLLAGSGGQIHNAEMELKITRDGEEHAICLEVSAERLILNGKTAICVTLVDITEQVRTTQALRQSEAKLSNILNGMKDVVWSISWPELQPLYISPSAEMLYGRPVQDFLDKPSLFMDVIHPNDRHLTDKAIKQLIEQGEAVRECRVVRPDGSIAWIVDRSRMILDDDGRPIRVDGLVQDITKLKQSELEREKIQEQLMQSQKMETVGRLAGGVAHDFNNLLSVIPSCSNFALEEVTENARLKEDLEEIRNAANRAAALTRQLLAFSRKQVLQPTTLNLNQIVSEMEKMLRRLLGENIYLIQNLAPDLGMVRADPGQMEQVLMNLAVNARDAMPDGGNLTIETVNVEMNEESALQHLDLKPGPYVQLAVTDTGTGMDKDTQAHIFEPFYTTKKLGNGTGLGLSTVYGIVKQSEGDIWLYSELGEGTTFKLFLPRKLDFAVLENKSLPVAKKMTGTETILLVEDEEALRKVGIRSLTGAGYTVLPASDATEAIRISGQFDKEIHLLLTDVILPGMNGTALAREIQEKHPKIRVLFMSGYTQDTIAHHGILDAGTNFLPKPFMSADLRKKVREVLDKPSAS